MATAIVELVPSARVLLGDITPPYDFHDEVIMAAARLTTGFLQTLGYEQGHTSSWSHITPDLTDKERMLWAKATQVLVRNPKALDIAMEAVSVRTEEVAYSTETGGRLAASIVQDDLNTLRAMILQGSPTIVARRPDYGLQLPLSSPYYGTDPNSD